MLFSVVFCLRRKIDFPCFMEKDNNRKFPQFLCLSFLRSEVDAWSLFRFSVSPSLRQDTEISFSVRLSRGLTEAETAACSVLLR